MQRTGTVAAVSVLFAASLAASPALADLYLGVGLGDFSSEFDDVGDVDIDFDEDSDASKAFAGWRFNPILAVQFDFIDFGDSTLDADLLDVEADARGFAPNVVATLPLGPIELFAKAGLLLYDLQVDVNGEALIDESGEDVIYGAGLGITVLDRLALRAEYEIVEISEVDDAEAAWITAAWRF